jgi:hypothetical protein
MRALRIDLSGPAENPSVESFERGEKPSSLLVLLGWISVISMMIWSMGRSEEATLTGFCRWVLCRALPLWGHLIKIYTSNPFQGHYYFFFSCWFTLFFEQASGNWQVFLQCPPTFLYKLQSSADVLLCLLAASWWFLIWLILWPWRQRRLVGWLPVDYMLLYPRR